MHHTLRSQTSSGIGLAGLSCLPSRKIDAQSFRWYNRARFLNIHGALDLLTQKGVQTMTVRCNATAELSPRHSEETVLHL